MEDDSGWSEPMNPASSIATPGGYYQSPSSYGAGSGYGSPGSSGVEQWLKVALHTLLELLQLHYRAVFKNVANTELYLS